MWMLKLVIVFDKYNNNKKSGLDVRDHDRTVADPGFPIGLAPSHRGGADQWRIQDFPLGGADPLGGHQPPMHTLFGKNVCENKRN